MGSKKRTMRLFRKTADWVGHKKGCHGGGPECCSEIGQDCTVMQKKNRIRLRARQMQQM